MFTPGSILHGIFHLKAITKPKYAIVLYNDGINCILTIFTTSEERSGVISPIHGKNPQDSEPLSYVFKKGVIVGELSNKGTVVPFSFPKDTVVVPDYGDQFTTQQAFLAEVTELIKCGELYPYEYENLIYTLYKSKKTKRKYKRIFEEILKNIIP
ncbi:MAG TPA: hypothetical protein H9848_09795 [Candidatus Parabacteroides intestinigallinarum]|uniref:Uncharacterized protein n=1 Tax=Candidatus Parabacteroides intestinigallinarum TaxID=2838722 RepID=A0A9D1XSD8_9BACT|nr:hypothetical protein [Candidatus Parabacteroides intestinigallinarum]